jgi:hypothetical protein
MTMTIAGNAGTGASGELLGTDRYGSIKITTGTGAGGGLIAQLTFGGPEIVGAMASLRVTPLNAATAGLCMGIDVNGGACASNSDGVNLFTSGPADSTTYEWAYCFQ